MVDSVDRPLNLFFISVFLCLLWSFWCWGFGLFRADFISFDRRRRLAYTAEPCLPGFVKTLFRSMRGYLLHFFWFRRARGGRQHLARGSFIPRRFPRPVARLGTFLL